MGPKVGGVTTTPPSLRNRIRNVRVLYSMPASTYRTAVVHRPPGGSLGTSVKPHVLVATPDQWNPSTDVCSVTETFSWSSLAWPV